MGENLPQVVAHGAEDGILGVSEHALQPVPSQLAVCFLVADPTAHLDSRLSEEFMELMGRFKAAGRTLLIASHDPIVYGSPLADAVVEMRDGRIVAGP